MENHPIPQDVTGFQFKLIGNMTVKQFAYLAVGIVLAWVILQIPIYFILKFPAAAFFAVAGISLAFLPVEGRPLDAMISHFIKALFSPTQFVYQKTGGRLYFPSPTISLQKNQQNLPSPQNDRLKAYLQSIPHTQKGRLEDKETNFLASLSKLTASAVIPKPKNEPMLNAVSQPSQEKSINETLEEQAEIVEKTLGTVKIEEQAVRGSERSLQKESIDVSSSHKKLSEMESKLQELSSQKEDLSQQLASLRQKMDLDKNVFTPSTAVPRIETKNVKRIPQSMSKNMGLPSDPTAPNIISGIVKDPRGNTLPNILVEVKDKGGNPVRAFKTNALGRFLSATPLANGVYIIEFDDPKGQQKFDTIEITVKNEIIMPLEIISIDTREELRKSLFGN